MSTVPDKLLGRADFQAEHDLHQQLDRLPPLLCVSQYVPTTQPLGRTWDAEAEAAAANSWWEGAAGTTGSHHVCSQAQDVWTLACVAYWAFVSNGLTNVQ